MFQAKDFRLYLEATGCRVCSEKKDSQLCTGKASAVVDGWPCQRVADGMETSLDAVGVGVRNGSGNGGMVAP